jgi:hypothetical protein
MKMCCMWTTIKLHSINWGLEQITTTGSRMKNEEEAADEGRYIKQEQGKSE